MENSYRIEIQVMQSILMSLREAEDASKLLWRYGKIEKIGYALPTPCRLNYERAMCIHSIIYLRGLMIGAYSTRKWLTRDDYSRKLKKSAENA